MKIKNKGHLSKLLHTYRSFSGVGRQVGLSRERIRQLANRYGLKSLHNGKIREKGISYKRELPYNRIIDMWNKGYCAKDVARKFNTTKGTIHTLISRIRNKEVGFLEGDNFNNKEIRTRKYSKNKIIFIS